MKATHLVSATSTSSGTVLKAGFPFISGALIVCVCSFSLQLFASTPTDSSQTITQLNTGADGNPLWELYVGEKISPVDEYAFLQTNNSLPELGYENIKVPDNLTSQAIRLSNSVSTSVWYRLLFEVAGDSVEVSESRKPMAIRLGVISDRDRTFINGKLVGETGDFGSSLPQAYDKLRIYEIPYGLLKPGNNVLHIQVEPYFPDELGIYRDRVALGPASEIWREFYLENAGQAITIMIYITFALYFLLFFIRRKQDRENLYFALFLFSMVTYSLLHTQFKYIYGWELYQLKRIQTLAVMFTLPLFYQFIRSFYSLTPGRFARIWDRIALMVHAIPLIGGGIVLISPSTVMWQATLDNLVQPGWLLYCIGIIVILTREILKRNRDALLMMVSILILMAAMILDILTGRAILNLPPLLTYIFVLFVITMALILVNRFVSLQEETISLNKQLVRFNAASRRFVPFEFLSLLEKGSIVDVNLGDQVQKEMAILFSDIRGFTSLSEMMTPRENIDFINSYLRRMGPVIRQNGGFIDKYIGDAIMALFATSPESAICSSIDMHEKLYMWNESRQKHQMVPVRIGVGIHVGRLMLGTIGENERLEGTVIADSVNLASRIESLTKLYGASVLISGDTKDTLKSPERYQLRLVDRVRVKGKNTPVELYELLDVLPSSELELRLKQFTRFNQAMQHYAEGNIDDAEVLFMEIYRESKDTASGVLIRRCRSLKEKGLPENWDGTTTLTSK